MGTRAVPGPAHARPATVPRAAPPPLDLPTDFAAGASPAPFGARLESMLPPALSAQLRQLADAHHTDVHAVLVAATHVLLHRYSGQDDVVVGAARARRGDPHDVVEVDHLTSPLPVVASFDEDPPFVELLDQVRDAVRATGAPDPAATDAAASTRASDVPLRVVVAMRDGGIRSLPSELVAIDASDARYDLTLIAADTTDGVELAVWHRTALFRAERIERLVGHLVTILGAAVAEPTRRGAATPLLSDVERAELASFNATALDVGVPSTVVEQFEGQAARVPSRVAVVASTPLATGETATASITYADLNARANRLARHLQRSGVVAGAPVGLLLPTSVDSIVAMLGIMKAEGAYMPLAIDAPPARLAQQLAESGARLVVTSAAMARRLPGTVTVVPLDSDAATLRRNSDADLPPAVRPRDTAYVLYTSGSTGVPRGVAVTHANIVHYTRAIRPLLGSGDDEPEREPARVYAMIGGLDADLGYTSLYPALLSGATLLLIGGDTADDEWIARCLEGHHVDVLKIAPSRLRMLIAGRTGASLAALLPREALVLGGETLDLTLARALVAAARCRVLNHYGPTELTVGALTGEVTEASLDDAVRLGASTVPIGRPLVNTHAYVIDAHGQEAPACIPGELWIGGAGASTGYLNRPAWTGERFVSFRGERVYRTGDRVRRLADGSIEFLGRFDEQVKLRGHRVELTEVEAALCTHPSIAAAAVVLHDATDATPELVAFAAPKRVAYEVTYDDPQSSERLVHWLAAQLPAHMIPHRIVLLDALPLLPNGKVDRAALRMRTARPR